MPYVFNNPDYQRSAEVLYRGQEYTGTPWDPALDLTATPVRPGMVAVLLNGTVTIASGAVAGGAFLGLFLTEVTAQLDESNNKDLSPTVVTGPATMKILNAALDGASSYAVAAGSVVELVVGTGLAAGKLVPRPGGNTQPTVATLTKVMADGIECRLHPESADAIA